jgi:hypothetical protein
MENQTKYCKLDWIKCAVKMYICPPDTMSKNIKKLDITNPDVDISELGGGAFDQPISIKIGSKYYWTFIIWLNSDSPKSSAIHEISHTVTHILQYNDINDDEVRAYLMGYLYDELVENKKKKKYNK